MTDTSILPGAALPTADVGQPLPPDLADEAAGDDRRRLLIIAGAVLALILVVAAYFMLRGGGSSSSSPAAGAVPRGTPQAATSPGTASGGAGSSGSGAPAKSGHGAAGTVLPPKSHTQLARDPFKALVAAPQAGGSVVGSTTVAPAQGTSPGTAPTSPSQGGAPSASLGAPQAIRLIRVHGTKDAVFDVTYSHHKVFRYDVIAPSASSSRGTVFGNDFALLGIQGRDATVQVGDATPFDLAVGSSHTV
jgi:hypothetical protein